MENLREAAGGVFGGFEGAGQNARARGGDSGVGALKSISGKKLCRLLKDAGCSLQRVRGSHHIFSKDVKRKIIIVTVHGNKNVGSGLATRIAKDAGLCW